MSDMTEKLKSLETYYQTQDSKLQIKDKWPNLNCSDYFVVVVYFLKADQSCSNLQEDTLNNFMSCCYLMSTPQSCNMRLILDALPDVRK